VIVGRRSSPVPGILLALAVPLLFAAGIAVSAQEAFSSGSTRRRACSRARRSARSTPWVPTRISAGLPPLGPK